VSVSLAPRRVAARSTAELANFISGERYDELCGSLHALRRALAGRRFVHITGDDQSQGGVVEILRSTLPYFAGAGVDTRWLDVTACASIRPTLEFFHLLGHGFTAEPRSLDTLPQRRQQWREFGAAGAEALDAVLEDDDVVVFHDTQTATMVGAIPRRHRTIIWRAHIGDTNRCALLREYWESIVWSISTATACVFYVPQYAPAGLANVCIQRPSIDPSTAKNRCIERSEARMYVANRLACNPCVTQHCGTVSAVQDDDVVALQISRWDVLKDMPGVAQAFLELSRCHDDFRGILVGPQPKSASEFAQLRACLAKLPADSADQRVHVLTLANSGSADHDSAIANLQSGADVAVQKSLREGFGLTVSEAMLRCVPVVASRTGGLPLQVSHGTTGLLCTPDSLEEFQQLVAALVRDSRLRADLGRAAGTFVADGGLIDRHLASVARTLTRQLL